MSELDKKIKARILVFGSVQDVGYRSRTLRQARKLGIKGVVRNLKDGSVEIFCTADDKEQFDQFIQEIKQNDFLIVVEEIKIFFEGDQGYNPHPLQEEIFSIEY